MKISVVTFVVEPDQDTDQQPIIKEWQKELPHELYNLNSRRENYKIISRLQIKLFDWSSSPTGSTSISSGLNGHRSHPSDVLADFCVDTWVVLLRTVKPTHNNTFDNSTAVGRSTRISLATVLTTFEFTDAHDIAVNAVYIMIGTVADVCVNNR